MNRIDPLEPTPVRPRLSLKARAVPVLTTIAGSAMALLPFIADSPIQPPFGLLMLLAWRLLRPELWQAWAALPLGLFDDLLSGQPLGSAMALWTIVMLTLDFTDNRAVWHDYLHDLLVAATALLFCIAGAWALAAFSGPVAPIAAMAPQWLLSILLMPIAIRLAARLDRFRLS